MKNTKIEWADHTANLWHGCTKVHQGCDNCYAETLSNRFGRDIWGANKPRLLIKKVFKELDSIQDSAFKKGVNETVFIGSMMDIFEKSMPLINTSGAPVDDGNDTGLIRGNLFTHISYNLYPNLFFLFLTKRPSNIQKYVPVNWLTEPPKNVFFGTSISTQENIKLLEQLCQIKGRLFVSMEPLLGMVNIKPYLHLLEWVIVGGESGHHARPMDSIWVQYIRAQCVDSNVPFFFKQWGQHIPIDQVKHLAFETRQSLQNNHAHGTMPDTFSLGKTKTGNLLNGKQHLNFPKW